VCISLSTKVSSHEQQSDYILFVISQEQSSERSITVNVQIHTHVSPKHQKTHFTALSPGQPTRVGTETVNRSGFYVPPSPPEVLLSHTVPIMSSETLAGMSADNITGMAHWRWAHKQSSPKILCCMPFLSQASQLNRAWDQHQRMLVIYLGGLHRGISMNVHPAVITTLTSTLTDPNC